MIIGIYNHVAICNEHLMLLQYTLGNYMLPGLEYKYTRSLLQKRLKKHSMHCTIFENVDTGSCDNMNR